MSAVVIQHTVRLTVVECCACGVLFGVPEELDATNQRATRDRSFYCPNGHSQSYLGKSHAQQLRDANAKAQALQDQLDAANRETARIAKRTAAGVCPCCTRSFVQLSRHIKSRHPEYAP